MHALVEPLVAAAQEGERPLAGELVGECVVELPAAGSEGDYPPLRAHVLGVAAVARL